MANKNATTQRACFAVKRSYATDCKHPDGLRDSAILATERQQHKRARTFAAGGGTLVSVMSFWGFPY